MNSNSTQGDAGKRERILNAAVSVFAGNGYQGATIAAIAAEAGVATGSVYSYFANKADLLLSVLLDFSCRINTRIAARLPGIIDPAQRVRIVFGTFQDLLLHDPQALAWSRIIGEGITPHWGNDPRLQSKRQAIEAENRKLVELMDRLIGEAQRAGRMTPQIKPQVLRQMFGGASQMLLYGLFLQHYRGQAMGYDGADVVTAMNALLDRFCTDS